MKNFFLLVILLFSIKSFSQKQRHKIDSLLQVLKISKEDTNRIQLYSSLASSYYSLKPDSFFVYWKKGFELAMSLKQKKYVAMLNIKMAAMMTDTGNYSLALNYAEQSLAVAKELNAKPVMINSYLEIGRVYDYQSDFVKSSDYFFKAMAIAQEINDHEKMALIGTNLCADFFNEGNYKKAEEYARITLKEGLIANSPIPVYKAYYIIAMIKTFTGDSAAAAGYFNKSIEVCQEYSFRINEAEVTTDLAMIQKNSEKKLELLWRARKVYDSLISPSSFDSRINWANLGETYISMYKAHPEQKDLLQKAEEYLTLFKEKSKQANDPISTAQGLNDLSKVNELKGNYRQAYELTTQYHAINDSIFSQENKNKIASLESQRAIDLKNKEIENKELQIGNQKKNMWLLVSLIAFLTVIGILLYRQSLSRKKTNTTLLQLNTELDEANKIKAKFFGILSHDLRSPVANLVNFLQLQKRKPGIMNEQQIADRENKIAGSANALLETMEAMLLWSKGQMEHFKPTITAVPVSNLFSYLQKFFADTEHVDFIFFCEDNLDVQTDENYLKAIMQNLTANATKALQQTPKAQVIWKGWKEQNKIYLSVTDNGPGANEEQLKALYDERVSSGAKHGLGLHIIRDLAKAIGCSISLQPHSSKGASFILSV